MDGKRRSDVLIVLICIRLNSPGLTKNNLSVVYLLLTYSADSSLCAESVRCATPLCVGLRVHAKVRGVWKGICTSA